MEAPVLRGVLLQMAPPPMPLSPAPAPLQCPELDLSITLSPERGATAASASGRCRGRLRKVRFDMTSESHPRTCSPDPAPSQAPDPVVSVTAEPSDVQSAAGKPPGKGKQDPNTAARRSHQPHAPAMSDTQLEEGAELNTTLALRAELQKLKEAEFDPEKAVKEKLQKSTLAQDNIRASAAKGLNFPRSQQLYHALVSVNLSHDQLVNQVMRDRPALAPPTSSYSSKVQCCPAEGPDLLFFTSPDQLIRETPLLPSDQLPQPRPRPAPRPPHATFHLHQRYRQWEV